MQTFVDSVPLGEKETTGGVRNSDVHSDTETSERCQIKSRLYTSFTNRSEFVEMTSSGSHCGG